MKFHRSQYLHVYYLREGFRRFSVQIAAILYSFPFRTFQVPEKLIVAPTDLRAIDPYIAEEIYASRFPLAGRVLDTGGRSPFALELPSRDFALRLHAFGWLRHVRATKSDSHCANARKIMQEWIEIHGQSARGIGWEPDIVAQRIIAWLSHSPVVLKGAEIGFYKRFLKNLIAQIRYLQRILRYMEPGEQRLRCTIALALASISLPASNSAIKRAGNRLNHEIDQQILPDGSHISRNPRVILDLLLDLLPLRQTYVNLGHDMPARLIPAIDRMYPALRFFRHNSGELALFNGATATLANEMLAVLRHDETSGQPYKVLRSSSFHRLSVKNTTVILDTGVPLTQGLSQTANAGCLSFEMSSGPNRFIVNSGAPRFAGQNLKKLARVSAAHTTVVLNDTSSMQMLESSYLGPIAISGVTEAIVLRHDVLPDSESVAARHNGYLDEYGVLYERDITVLSGGHTVRGRDRFLKPDGKEPDDSDKSIAVARFHIHPNIDVQSHGKHHVRLMAADGEVWIFSCIDAEIQIADDVFFADPSGVRRSQQLEIEYAIGSVPEIQWVLEYQT
jgi:uncharacterized heparinase superfamily protein